jgi:hypothetical protein
MTAINAPVRYSPSNIAPLIENKASMSMPASRRMSERTMLLSKMTNAGKVPAIHILPASSWLPDQYRPAPPIMPATEAMSVSKLPDQLNFISGTPRFGVDTLSSVL